MISGTWGLDPLDSKKPGTHNLPAEDQGKIAPGHPKKLEKGVFLEGERLNPFASELIKTTSSGNSWLKVTIHKDKKHILRNDFKYSSHLVEKLHRVAIGTLTLGMLPLSEWR